VRRLRRGLSARHQQRHSIAIIIKTNRSRPTRSKPKPPAIAHLRERVLLDDVQLSVLGHARERNHGWPVRGHGSNKKIRSTSERDDNASVCSAEEADQKERQLARQLAQRSVLTKGTVRICERML
jgi:hypothetical protein